MTTAMLHQRHPPTPPLDELPYDLHHISRHNRNDFAAQVWPTQSEAASNQAAHTQVDLPGLMRQNAEDPCMTEPYTEEHYSAMDEFPDSLGISYPGYSNARTAFLPAAGSSAPNSPFQDSAMTPPRSTASDALSRRSRKTRSATQSSSPFIGAARINSDTHRVTKPAARSKKAGRNSTNNKAVANKGPKLTTALSILTKDMDVPVRDMAAWVRRPLEVRQAEVSKRNGYVTRPMNSFMLYRSAFAERTKKWRDLNNHQLVSSVIGESWPLEAPELRQYYEELAKEERKNHQNAHPQYKFSPSKVGLSSKKKKSDSNSEADEEDYFSSGGDPDDEWRPRNDRGKSTGRSTRTGARSVRDVGSPDNRGIWPYDVTGIPRENALVLNDEPYSGHGYQSDHQSQFGWDSSKPLPVAMGSHEAYLYSSALNRLLPCTQAFAQQQAEQEQQQQQAYQMQQTTESMAHHQLYAGMAGIPGMHGVNGGLFHSTTPTPVDHAAYDNGYSWDMAQSSQYESSQHHQQSHNAQSLQPSHQVDPSLVGSHEHLASGDDTQSPYNVKIEPGNMDEFSSSPSFAQERQSYKLDVSSFEGPEGVFPQHGQFGGWMD